MVADHEVHLDAEHEVHHGHYLIIFMVLCILTALSVVSDVVHIESHALVIVIVMAVAVAKSTCVALFFMHLKFERGWKYVLLAPTTILAIGIPLALFPDIAVHYYRTDVPQMRAAAQAEAAIGDVPAHTEGTHPE